MKTFRYERGHVAGTTMTVAELCAKLQEYPPDMPVFATWEGVLAWVRPGNFSVETQDKVHADDACPCLLIDVEAYF